MSLKGSTYKKLNFEAHSNTDIKNSWYWSVLVKNMGSWAKARKAIDKSRKMVDPCYKRFN